MSDLRVALFVRGYVKLWTIQISKHRLAKERGIPLKDITVKSGDKLFAPTWDVLMEYKNSNDEDRYTSRFIPLMRNSYKNNKEHWVNLCSMEEVAIACYCREGCFCHRYLMVDILEKVCNNLGIQFEYKGELK